MGTRLKRLIGVAALCACGTLPLDGQDAQATDGGGGDTTTMDVGTNDTGADATSDADASACSSGQVLCNGVCQTNDVDHCGPSCAVCSKPSLGTATCDGTSCGIACDFLECSGTCVDPSTDTKNCGTCNHDCGTEACSAGVCVPEKLYANVQAYGLAIDSTNLYWATGSEIDQGSKTGTSWSAIAKNVSMVVATPVVDAANVYWSVDYGVAFVPIGGGTVTTLASTTAQWPCIPGLGPQAIYLGDYSNSASLFAIPYDGGTPVALETTLLEIVGASYSGPYVYFAGWGGAPPLTLWRASASTADAGSELVFTHDAGYTSFPPFVMDDAGTTYVMTSDGVWVVPPDGGAPSSASTSRIISLAIDSTYIYMASAGAIYREPIGGTSAAKLYTAPTQDIHGITIDNAYVYFSFGGTSTPGIYRMAK